MCPSLRLPYTVSNTYERIALETQPERVEEKEMKTRITLTAVAVAGALAVISTPRPAAAQGEKTKLPPVIGSFWGIPKDTAGTIELVVSGAKDTVIVAIAPETGVGGVCMHCTLNQPFKVKDVKKTCGVCGCSKTNGTCVSWKDLKVSSWEEMITSLPAGTALRVAYNTPDDPKSGLKTIWIDRRTFFAPVEGLAGKTPAELAAIGKAIGGGKVEAVDDNKRLLIAFKQDYDSDQEAKLIKALAKIGVTITRPTDKVAATK